jgi:Phosphodiester glycosidase/AMIN domain
MTDRQFLLSIALSLGSLSAIALIDRPMAIAQSLIAQPASPNPIEPNPEDPNPQPQTAQQGTILEINGRAFSVAWSQWRDETGEHIGIADTGLTQAIGLELLDTDDFSQQPIQWFSDFSSHPMWLSARLSATTRYLAIEPLAQQLGWQWQITGDRLQFTSPPAAVKAIRQGQQSWGTRIVLDFDRGTPWQLERRDDRWTIIVDAATESSLLEPFRPQRSNPTRNLLKRLFWERDRSERKNTNTARNDEDNPGADEQKNNRLFDVQVEGTRTRIDLYTSAAVLPRIFTLPNPDRLVIDLGADPIRDRNLLWAPGIRWRQQTIAVGTSRFPVVWLELDWQQAQFDLQTIWVNPQTQKGIAPLATIAADSGAAVAINAGFFDRNTQLSLGAIRRDETWFSGPILNRGAIGWTEAGDMVMARLSLQETLMVNDTQQLPLQYLNSGFPKAGVSRYTPEWGDIYTPLQDNEVAIVVEDNLVTRHVPSGKAGSTTIPIPRNGYLLVARFDRNAVEKLPVGASVRVEQTTNPSTFDRYPQILAAGPLLVENRQIVLNAPSEQFNPAFATGRAARSAIARTEAGTVLFVAIHHSGSGVGPTLTDTAQIMAQLGAIDALNLDGGSSTSLYLGGHLINRSPQTAARVHNGLGIFLVP